MYGTQQAVATMASTWTNDGVWEDPVEEYIETFPGSNPTLSEVEDWLDEVSAQFDIALGAHSFVAPIDPAVSPTAFKAVSRYVVNLVADLCAFKNSSGRYFTEKLIERGITPMAAILRDMHNYIELHADGFVADNVPQVVKTSIRKQSVFRVVGKL